MRPVIGIVMCGSENGRQFVSQPYLDAVTDAGGLPRSFPSPGIPVCMRAFPGSATAFYSVEAGILLPSSSEKSCLPIRAGQIFSPTGSIFL